MANSIVSTGPDHWRLPDRNSVATPDAGRWPSHISYATRINSIWTVERRIPVEEILRAPRAALDVLRGIEDDISQAAQPSLNGPEREVVVSFPAISEDGFDLDLHVGDGRIAASFGGLNQDFLEVRSAMIWVRRALSRQYQLRILSVGRMPCEWLLEPIVGGGGPAECLSAGYPVLLRRWRKMTVDYRRNVLIDLSAIN